jgi:hypothetical protein
MLNVSVAQHTLSFSGLFPGVSLYKSWNEHIFSGSLPRTSSVAEDERSKLSALLEISDNHIVPS